MSGGRVRIAIPSGWKVSGNLVTVIDNPGGSAPNYGSEVLLYNTAVDGTQLITGPTASKFTGRVSFSADNHIIVDLDAAWSSIRSDTDIQRELRITFGDVTTPVPNRLRSADNRGTTTGDAATDDDIPYEGYPFSSSSSAKGGNLRVLGTTPTVRVGNILGEKVTTTPVAYAGRDTRDRNFDVTPLRVYVGEEKHEYMITFTAPGPMYGATLAITLPDGPPASTTRSLNPNFLTVADLFTVRGSSGVGLTVGDTLSADSVPITLNTINNGQKVFVTYSVAEIPSTATTSFAPSSLQTRMRGANDDVDATKLANKGGTVGTLGNSGRLQISPASLEAGSKQRPFTLTFTANTKLTNFTLMITPGGINLEDTNPNDNIEVKLQTDSSGKYGHVTGSVSSTASTLGTLTVPSNVITWTGVTLAKDDKLITNVSRVDVLNDAGTYPWATTVTMGTAD